MPQPINIKPGDFIRYIYNGTWEYCRWNGDGTRNVICAQKHLDEWKSGKPIKPLILCKDEKLQSEVLKQKERLRDGTSVIQGVWKNQEFEPRKIVTS